MRKHIKDESVDLVYIDPPFNSKRNYNQIYNNIGGDDKALTQAFMDTWVWDDAANEGLTEILENQKGLFTGQSVELVKGLRNVLKEGSLLAYLISMTLRIVEVHRILKPTGSFYLHCDPASSHYLKLVMDAVFCAAEGEYQNEIIWRRTGAHNKLTRYGPIHDTILFYTKTSAYTWNFPKRPYMKGHVEENFIHDETGYRTNYYGNVLTGSGVRGGESGQTWQGFNPTAKGRHWAIPGALLEDIDEDLSGLTQHQKLDRLLELGHIQIIPGQAWPMYSRYLKASDGQAVSDIWAFQPYTGGTVFGTSEGVDEDVRWLSTKDKERLGYPTQKPTALLGRIIEASSNEGDLVLDAYCGCGTTVEVAHKLKRKWIGIDITYQSISLVLRRLQHRFEMNTETDILLDGVPRDMASAVSLANKKDDRVRKEFEKWAVLTYSNNRAIINPKKGADKGIDGIAYFMVSKTDNEKVIFQVKSGAIGSKDIRDLRGTVEQEKAALGIFITLQEPTSPMTKAAHASGTFHHAAMGRSYDKIQIVTIKDIIEKKARFELPLSHDVLSSAEKDIAAKQIDLFG